MKNLLTKDQTAQHKELTDALNKLWEDVADAINAFNEAGTELDEFRSEIADELEEQFSEKSEKWQESDRGNEFQEIIDGWREEFECAEEPDMPELPEVVTKF